MSPARQFESLIASERLSSPDAYSCYILGNSGRSKGTVMAFLVEFYRTF
jgi:hypothetical protein